MSIDGLRPRIVWRRERRSLTSAENLMRVRGLLSKLRERLPLSAEARALEPSLMTSNGPSEDTLRAELGALQRQFLQLSDVLAERNADLPKHTLGLLEDRLALLKLRAGAEVAGSDERLDVDIEVLDAEICLALEKVNLPRSWFEEQLKEFLGGYPDGRERLKTAVDTLRKRYKRSQVWLRAIEFGEGPPGPRPKGALTAGQLRLDNKHKQLIPHIVQAVLEPVPTNRPAGPPTEDSLGKST